MYKIPRKTVFIGKRIISLSSCESTNSLLISMAQTDRLDEGTVLVAEEQTAGRGQAGNRWVAERGANLTFSVLLRPNFIDASQQFYLNMAVGLAVRNAILDTHGAQWRVDVKWPNDVMVAGKKVSGILIENQVQGQRLSQSVVGIGLNVNQKSFEWPEASSLSLMLGRDFDKAKVFEDLMTALDERYLRLRQRDFQKLKADYISVLFWRGEEHEFESQGKSFLGVIEGVDEVGRLLVQAGGGTQRFDFKAIKFLQ
jgi:BirA family transcriptional regulator, biotin operon repressor / biotin---[acetyl-CoA-carboxylase] ligase